MRYAELKDDDVVITGRGIVSPIGNRVADVLESLRAGRSGVTFDPDFATRGFRSHVSGRIRDLPDEPTLPKVRRASMSRASLYSTVAVLEAVREAGLTDGDLQRETTGVVIGTGAGGLGSALHNYDRFKAEQSSRHLGAHCVDTTMASTCAANATVVLRTRGVSEALSSACATGLHCIGHAYRLVRHGYQDTIIAGSADEDGWPTALGFDAMRVLCSDSNDRPSRASRPFDASRSGFVAAGGGAAVVVERAARARARGARPIARIAGYFSGSDGSGQMLVPSVAGQVRALEGALHDARVAPGDVEYVKLHGTSTVLGDRTEVAALGAVRGRHGYRASSVKSQTGHTLAAAGAIEAVACTLMLEHQFVSANANLERLDEELEAFRDVLVNRPTPTRIQFALSNNFGFGNTNTSMLFENIEA